MGAAVLTGWCGISALADEPPDMVQTNTNLNMPTNDYTMARSDDYVGKLGAGITLGEPTGATLKYWLNDTLAVDGALGWSTHDDSNLYLHSDVLWHNFNLIPVPQGRLPVYIGAGGLVRFRDNHRDNEAGIRLPLGMSYMFENAPVDIYVEFGPAIICSPDVRADFTGGIGIRYWF